MTDKIPMKRCGLVSEIAGLAAFIAGPPGPPRPSSNPTQFPSTCWRLPWTLDGAHDVAHTVKVGSGAGTGGWGAL